MLDIYVDADACPVKDEILRVAERHGLAVIIVSNRGQRPSPNPLVRSVMVPHGPDVADDWIAEHIGAGDVCVTNDIPLAARCVAKKALVLSPSGKRLDDASIGMAVAVRDLMTDLRSAGAVTGGPPPFSQKDRSRFLNAFEAVVQAIKRTG